MQMIYVTAAILIVDGKVLIAKRKYGDPLADKWEFPGGKKEAEETLEAALEREMWEEFQIRVAIRSRFGESRWRYPHADIHLIAYLVAWESGELKPTVHNEYRWVKIEELSFYDLAPADIPLALKLQQRTSRL